MDDLGFGLWMTVMGMGTVFLLLILLMLVLVAIGRLDQRRTTAPGPDPTTGPAEDERAPGVDVPGEGGLSPAEIAAITVAVLTHARVLRAQAAPAMREIAPGSQIHASRWVSIGRTYQTRPWR